MTFEKDKQCATVEREHMTPMELLTSGEVVKICAPMVRYSKLPFRTLVRKYGCDLAFTPMIISNAFVQSLKARDSEFTTNSKDRPLIAQFAASDTNDFADAAEIVAPYADGIDLNCGCPQRWALKEGYGACMINKPELMCDMVKQAKARVTGQDFTVSVKIRIHHDMKKTVELCRQVEKTGASFISVHGRTVEQRAQPVNYEAIKLIKENLQIPVIANGDIKSMDDVVNVRENTGVNGVMAARGILTNPAMYAGYTHTPHQCVKDWIDIALSMGVPFAIFHHHLVEMLDLILPKGEKRVFNGLASTSAVLDFLSAQYNI